MRDIPETWRRPELLRFARKDESNPATPLFSYRMVGIENSAPLLMPLGQRCVMVLVLV